MDFIKHNLIFVIILGICVVMMGVMVFLCMNANGRLQAQMEQMNKTQQYLKKFAAKKIKPEQKNVDIANETAAEAGKMRDDFNRELRERFQLKFQTEENGFQALRIIKNQVADMRNLLLDNDIVLSQKMENLTFDEYVRATLAPSKEDLPKIFRRLELVRRMLGLLIAAKAKDTEDSISLDSLTFIKKLDVHDEQLYTITPMELVFTSSSQEGQAFINLLDKADGMLFFIRNVTVKSPVNVTPAGAEAGLNTQGTTVSRNSEGEGMGMGMGGRGGRRRGEQPQAESAPQKQDENGSKIIELPKYRQEMVAFEAAPVTWTLRVDFLEFVPEKKPEAPKGDEQKNEGGEPAAE